MSIDHNKDRDDVKNHEADIIDHFKNIEEQNRKNAEIEDQYSQLMYVAGETLPRQCKQVFQQHYIYRLKNEQISKKFGISKRTVGNTYDKGLPDTENRSEEERQTLYFFNNTDFMNNPRRIGRLLYRKSRNELNESEERELTVWRKESPENEQLFLDKMDPEKVRSSMIRYYEKRDLIFEKIKKRVPELADANLSNQDFSDFKEEGKYARMSPARILRRATFGLIVLSVIVVILLRACGILHKTVEGDPDAVFNSPEGIENAGDEINLGFYMGKAGIDPVRNQIGGLDYYASSKNRDKKLRYTVSTALKGNLRHARLILPDSTRIWMNISTWIKYPRNFSQDWQYISVWMGKPI